MINSNDIVYAQKQRLLRKSKKIKQTVFAELMGWKGQQECSEYENGKRHYSEDTLRKLCKVLSTSFEDFIKLKSIKNEKPDFQKPNNSSGKSKIKTGSSQDESLLLMHFKKILLEKEMTIRELKLELCKYRSLNKTLGFQTDSDKKIYVLI